MANARRFSASRVANGQRLPAAGVVCVNRRPVNPHARDERIDAPGEKRRAARYLNRPITILRATALGRSPAERVAAALQVLDRLVDSDPNGTVTTSSIGEGSLVRIAGQSVFAILADDVDTLAGETFEGRTADAAARLSVAFREAAELRSPSRLLVSVVAGIGMTFVYLSTLWVLGWPARRG
jgi:hypothetical protein